MSIERCTLPTSWGILAKEREEVSGIKHVTTSWLIVSFGEHRVVAQLIAKSALISPLIHKDFPVRPLSSLVAILLP
jgi:hypothetical protein